MKSVLNQQSLLWIIGVLQPVSSNEILAYLELGFETDRQLPDAHSIHKFCMTQERKGRLIRVERNPDLFSLSFRANNLLTKEHRLARDKARIYLLKDARRSRVRPSRADLATGLDGDAPSADERTTTKGSEVNKNGLVVPSGQSYWPRFSKQLLDETGRSQPSRDISHLPLLSFFDKKQVAVAANAKFDELDFDYRTLGLMLGVSPRLVLQIARRPERHYRSFTLKKKGGGERPIESPRVFLKVIQQFLNDYILTELPLHECVQSYRSGRSIVSNAYLHTGRSYVANIDIQNFFGSVSLAVVREHLQRNGFSDFSAAMIGKLCTKDGSLPQGASTSPVLSNSVLYEFDFAFSEQCYAQDLIYSRYADDITISGDNRNNIGEAIAFAQDFLGGKLGLQLNHHKTRIASKSGQQRVTGVIVNSGVKPPRQFRRNVRAAFFNAQKAGRISLKDRAKLQGYLSYLLSFPELRDTAEVTKYKTLLGEIEILRDG